MRKLAKAEAEAIYAEMTAKSRAEVGAASSTSIAASVHADLDSLLAEGGSDVSTQFDGAWWAEWARTQAKAKAAATAAAKAAAAATAKAAEARKQIALATKQRAWTKMQVAAQKRAQREILAMKLAAEKEARKQIVEFQRIAEMEVRLAEAKAKADRVVNPEVKAAAVAYAIELRSTIDKAKETATLNRARW